MAIAAIAALGCGGLLGEPAPDVANPRTEVIGGVTFKVPGNWTTTTEYADGLRNTTVESDGSAFAMVQEFDQSIQMDASAYAKLIRDELEGQVDATFGDAVQTTKGDVSPVSRPWFGQMHEGATVPVSVGAAGIVVPFTLEVFQREVDGHTLLVYTQVADEDAAVVRPAFDLIVGTMAAKN